MSLNDFLTQHPVDQWEVENYKAQKNIAGDPYL